MSDLIERDNTIKEIDEHLAFVLQTYNKRYGNSDNEYIAGYKRAHEHIKEVITLKLPSAQPEQQWTPCSERLPSDEERKEWINKNLDGIGYLYPCLVTRYSSINPDRTKNNPYVAKHYFDGEDFVNNGEEVCTEYIIAWMPLPEPWRGEEYERK